MSILAEHQLDAKSLLQVQQQFFASDQTRPLAFRKQQLQKLKKLIEQNEAAILEALHQDLRKHEFEAYATEIGFVLVELNTALQQLDKWAKPEKVGTPLFHFKASSQIYSEPYGNILVIAPWNYPFQLLLAPVIGAIAAGNTVVMKPSEYAPHTAKLVTKMINEHFEPGLLKVVEGGVEETQALLKERWDYIFFTGGTAVGKIIYQAAAKHLTPVTLELGGKSPCIVDKDTHLDYTAKRIVWGKFINAGQTCIAPDYLLVDRKVVEPLKEKLAAYIRQFFGENPQQSNSYPRIVNERHFNRLVSYLSDGRVFVGGQHEVKDLYLAPTLLTEVKEDSPVMQDEIFGPILPILTYDNLGQAIEFIRQRPKPLALYIFSKDDKKVERVLEKVSAGGVTVNDTLMHIANAELPFGGVGDSGIGAYHGQHSFDLFSHKKSVLKRSFMIDDPVRYAPYKMNIKWLRRLMDWTL